MFETQSTFAEVAESWDAGGKPIRSMKRPAGWDGALAGFERLMTNADGLSVRKWQARVEEASGASDFTYLNADTIDRKLLAAYKTRPRVMRQIARLDTALNFLTAKRFAIDPLGAILPEVAERGPYEIDKLQDRRFQITCKKRGRIVPFSWESMINDDLGAYNRLPEALAATAISTEDYLLTALFWNNAGPLDTYFDVTNVGEDGVSNKPLTAENLAYAIQVMTGGGKYAFNDVPIVNVPRYLVVPPALEITAQQLLMSMNVAYVFGGTITPTQMPTANVIANRGIQLLVNPWIPYIVTTGTLASTTWALFSESVPACELDYVMGHETPELFIRNSRQDRIGGGSSAFDGSWEDDTIAYKIRVTPGVTVLDPRGGWASDGQ